MTVLNFLTYGLYMYVYIYIHKNTRYRLKYKPFQLLRIKYKSNYNEVKTLRHELYNTNNKDVELTSTFLLYRGLVHHHHRILNKDVYCLL